MKDINTLLQAVKESHPCADSVFCTFGVVWVRHNDTSLISYNLCTGEVKSKSQGTKQFTYSSAGVRIIHN